MVSRNTIALLASVSTTAFAQACKLQFDGRVPSTFNVTTFDTANNVFNPSFIFGKGMLSPRRGGMRAGTLLTATVSAQQT